MKSNMGNNKKDRVSIRITPNQTLVLQEMSEAMGTSISMMIRTILGDWITKNEDYIYAIIDRKKIEGDANYQHEENIFDE